MTDVTVISCVYGHTHDAYVRDWADGVGRLSPEPYAVTVAADRPREVMHGAAVPVFSCHWAYPQAFYLDVALDLVGTEWVWIHDIDDVAFPDALEGLDEVAADVWQLGYVRSDGKEYVPPQLSAAEVLASEQNPFVAGSCVRTAKLREVGGFPDVALQDWALWRNLAHTGATFQSSDRAHFHYRRHPDTRGKTELTARDRQSHIDEMLARETSALAV